MRQETRERMEEHINCLTENKEKFLKYRNIYYEKILFSGPSTYFHKKTIDMVENSTNFEDLFNNDILFEYLYATLTAWGLHRMGPKGAKLKKFKKFKKNLENNKDRIINLSKFEIQKIKKEQIGEVIKKLADVFMYLDVMESKSSIVGNSKALHHLLPCLVPPIDRQRTLKFFYGYSPYDKEKDKEKDRFILIFKKFYEITKKLNLTKKDIGEKDFDTSIPKLIDNAIMGYVIEEIEKRR